MKSSLNFTSRISTPRHDKPVAFIISFAITLGLLRMRFTMFNHGLSFLLKYSQIHH
jgi:hypothetical protein